MGVLMMKRWYMDFGFQKGSASNYVMWRVWEIGLGKKDLLKLFVKGRKDVRKVCHGRKRVKDNINEKLA